MSSSERTHILFLCIGNACRSQIADGLMRRLDPESFEIYSAGVKPAGFVHELAQQVVSEVGGDLSSACSKGLQEFEGDDKPRIDVVVSFSKHASRVFRTRGWDVPLVEWPMADPIEVEGNDEDKLTAFRWVRDEICIRLEDAIEDGSLLRSNAVAAAKPTGLRRLFAGFQGRG